MENYNKKWKVNFSLYDMMAEPIKGNKVRIDKLSNVSIEITFLILTFLSRTQKTRQKVSAPLHVNNIIKKLEIKDFFFVSK